MLPAFTSYTHVIKFKCGKRRDLLPGELAWMLKSDLLLPIPVTKGCTGCTCQVLGVAVQQCVPNAEECPTTTVKALTISKMLAKILETIKLRLMMDIIWSNMIPVFHFSYEIFSFILTDQEVITFAPYFFDIQ